MTCLVDEVPGVPARRQAAPVGGSVVVFKDGEIVRGKPAREPPPQERSDGGAGLRGERARKEIDEMGVPHVDVTIRNPSEPERSWKGPFLVDTGAIDSLVPRPCLEAIGIEPEGQRVYELADGSEIEMDVAVARIEFMGEFVGGTIIFGDADAEPLLGVTALESVGVEIDPQNQRLKKLPAVRLKGLRTGRPSAC